MNLVIVESPSKGKTIEQYLGKDYKVLASYGHVRDLPKSKIGIDTEHDYEPSYIIPTKAKKVLTQLKNEAKVSDLIFLATDYDREGEAIAWHIAEALGMKGDNSKLKRITFHEITKEAILESIKQPRALDMDLVNAQQARRVLDRLVGYKLSPFLWKKIYTGLSAGRVQSVAVRLIVDREREIQAFIPTEYWSIEADLEAKKEAFTGILIKRNEEKIEKLSLVNKGEADAMVSDLDSATYRVAGLDKRTVARHPHGPFTTSTLQQTASHQLGYSAKRTMSIAQRLYEAGHITYMRTDSTNLSNQAVSAARSYIEKSFGAKYLSEKTRIYKTRSKGAQEAHEAIRPTHPDKSPDEMVTQLNEEQAKLYELIWKRLIACQMESASLEQVTLQVAAKGKQDSYTFRANGQNVLFEGFLRLWQEKLESKTLPELVVGDPVDLLKLRSEQHLTEPPARFNEASLIKTLEENGIGRPSTYAPTISTIVDRGYVVIENRQLLPQEVGFIVIDLLKEHFPNIVDVNFTATIEEDFDKIAEGAREWQKVIDAFYQPFETLLKEKEVSVEKRKTEEATDQVCELCGKPMVIKLGRFGRFLACTGFPECKNTKAILKSTGIMCPKCNEAELAERKTRRRRTFWGCAQYPKCDFATWDDPIKVPPVYDPNAVKVEKPEPKAVTKRKTKTKAKTKKKSK